MKLRGCSEQADLAAAVRAGHWPDGCDPALRAHVAECRCCDDFVLIAQIFQQARAEASQQTPPGSPEALWWTAQVRRRNHAVERMALPIVLAEITALICTFAALAFSLWGWGRVTDLSSITSFFVWQPDTPMTSGLPMLLVIGASVTLLLFGSLAAYLLAHQE